MNRKNKTLKVEIPCPHCDEDITVGYTMQSGSEMLFISARSVKKK